MLSEKVSQTNKHGLRSSFISTETHLKALGLSLQITSRIHGLRIQLNITINYPFIQSQTKLFNTLNSPHPPSPDPCFI